MQDAARGAATGRPPGATAPSYRHRLRTRFTYPWYACSAVTESDQVGWDNTHQTSLGCRPKSIGFARESRGAVAARFTAYRGYEYSRCGGDPSAVGGGRTLIENLCVRDQHRSRGLTKAY